MACWGEPFVHLRMPKLFHLRRDPFERADENSNSYWDWFLAHTFILQAAVGVVMHLIETLKDYPPRQRPGSFNLDKVVETMMDAAGGGKR
jgi:arylsulfatase